MSQSADHVAVWQEWVEHGGPIYKDIINMNYRRVLFRGFMNGVLNLQSRFLAAEEREGTVDLSWALHYGHAYFTEQAVAVRRQIDRGGGGPVITLRRLFDEVEQHSHEVSGSAYAGWGSGERAGALHTYYRLFGAGGDHLDRASWLAKRKTFVDAATPIKRRVDKTLAHADEAILSDQSVASALPATYTDLHDAVKELTDAFCHAYLLLTGADLDPVPAIQHDYRAPFRSALFRPIPGGEWSIPADGFPDEAEDLPAVI